MELQWQTLESLAEMPGNPKLHDLPAIERAAARWGFLDPLLVNLTTGRLLSGHGRLKALRAMRADGEAPPRYVKMVDSGAWLAPVVVVEVPEAEEWEAAFALNRIQELGGLEPEILAAELRARAENVEALAAAGVSGEYLREALERAAGGGDTKPHREKPKRDFLWDLPEAPRSQRGQVWKLGDHLVACAEAFEAETVPRLLGGELAAAVVTDPPYAIYGSSTGVASSVADDSMVRPFFATMFRTIAAHVAHFGHVYVFCDWRSWSSLWDASKGSGLVVGNMFVWDKQSSGLGFFYLNCHELVMCLSRVPAHRFMKQEGDSGARGVPRPNLQPFPRVSGEEREHNAQKPVDLAAEFVRNSTEPGDLVLDMFGGSGTTLIACEELGRRARLCEKEPGWVDVIVNRWETMTGRRAELVER